MNGMLLLFALTSTAALPPVEAWGGGHDIEVSEGKMRVRSRILWQPILTGEGMATLVQPLPAEAEVQGAGVAEMRNASGEIVGFRIELVGVEPESSLVTEVPYAEDRMMALPIPVPSGGGIHRVRFERRWSFEPDPAQGLVTRVGYLARFDLPREERRPVDARLDGGPYKRPLGAVYLKADGPILTQGRLRGALARRRSVGFIGLLGLGFGGLVIGLLWNHRRLRRAVRVEAAEALLDREWAKIQNFEWPRRTE